ncbi:MAG: hypothetical protein MJ239_05555 [Bacilli bacterium]|nr:hypothetical protein [Bacilli bacterium]
MPNIVKIGNILYFLPMILLVLTCALLVWACRKKGEKFADNLVFSLCLANFVLHFVKQFMPGYIWVDWPYSLRQSTPENLCALLITLSPFLYKWGGTYMKDYLVVIGLVSGLVVFIAPSTALSTPLVSVAAFFEVARFYLCHAILIIVAVLIALSGFHKFSYKRIPMLLVLFLAAQTIIVMNELLLWGSRLVDLPFEYFWSRDVRNASLSFGPSSSVDPVLEPLYWMCGVQWEVDHIRYFVPVLWMILPSILLGMPLIFVLTLPFTHKEIKDDCAVFAQKLKMKTEEIKAKRRAA